MQNLNSSGATPSTGKMFGWFTRLETMTSLKYFWTESAFNRVAPHPPSYLAELFDRVTTIKTKRFDRKNLVLVFLVGESPNIEVHARRDRPLARFTELPGKYMGSRKDPI